MAEGDNGDAAFVLYEAALAELYIKCCGSETHRFLLPTCLHLFCRLITLICFQKSTTPFLSLCKMSSKDTLAARAIVSIMIALVETAANVMSGPNTFHPSGFRLCQRTVLDFIVNDCYLLFDMDCRDLFTLLCGLIVASSTWPSCLISCIGRPMASSRIPNFEGIITFDV